MRQKILLLLHLSLLLRCCAAANFKFSVSLKDQTSEDDNFDQKFVLLSTLLSCGGDNCEYQITEENYSILDFTVLVNGISSLNGSFNGAFNRRQFVNVTIQNNIEGDFLKLFALEYEENPNVVILGCDSGLFNEGSCTKISQALESFDEVCVCAGTQQTYCDETTSLGVCSSQTVTWWQADCGCSTSKGSTTSPKPFSYSLSDVSVSLQENNTNSELADIKKILISANMNCSANTCAHQSVVSNSVPDYYTVTIGNSTCDAAQCSGQFSRGDTVPVIVKRKVNDEHLILFSYIWIDEMPGISIIGCYAGLLFSDTCLRSVTMATVGSENLLDTVCSCQGNQYGCNNQTEIGQCIGNDVTWWKEDNPYSSSVAPIATTSLPARDPNLIDLTFLLSEGMANDDPKNDHNVTITAWINCNDTSCYFRIAIVDYSETYYTVLVSNNTCPNAVCSGTLQKGDQIGVVVTRIGEILSIFDLEYYESPNVAVLGCTYGMLSYGHCQKASYNASTLQKNDNLCVCQSSEMSCEAETTNGACSDGHPVWWKPSPFPTLSSSTTMPTTTSVSAWQTTFHVALSETESSEITKRLNLSVTMACSDLGCSYTVNVTNDSSSYFGVYVNNTDCPQKCESFYRYDQEVDIDVQKYGQTLDLIKMGYKSVTVLGCENGYYVVGKCVKITHENDTVCSCQGIPGSCDQIESNAICTAGTPVWWQPSPYTSSTEEHTTTFYDTKYQFSLNLSLSEGNNNLENQVQFSSTMLCTSDECGYSIQVGNLSESYFTVRVDNLVCQNSRCEGSFLRGTSVNVTVYRGNQVLDLFDFEYIDIPRIVVLGCEEGLSEYQECLKASQAISIANEDYMDVVCSCRSTAFDCGSAKVGVCTRGEDKWWRNVDESSSTSPPTTPSGVPSLQDLANSTITLSNVTQALDDTLHYSCEGAMLNSSQIYDITKILHKSANLAGISTKNAVQILQNMDQVLNAHEREIRNGQSNDYRLLALLSPMVKNTNGTIIQYLKGMNLGFSAKQVDCKNIDSDDGLIDYGPDIGFAPLNDTNKLTASRENAIMVPLESVCGSREITHAFFTIYRDQKLFTGPQAYRTYGSHESSNEDQNDELEEGTTMNDTNGQTAAPAKCSPQLCIPKGTPVLSATVMENNDTVNNIATGIGSQPIMAKLQFNVGKMPKPLHGNTIISWFNTGKQEWDLEEQCTLLSNENGVIQASCDHLTDFSVLIHGQLNAEYVCSLPLIIIGYSVNGTSVLCLLLLVIIGLMFYIRSEYVGRALSYISGQDPTNGDMVNLAYHSIFFMFFILSLFFMDQSGKISDSTTTSTYCVVIAAMSYFSLISAIIISMLIGLRMICNFFPSKLRAFFTAMTSPSAALSIGLAVPFVFTLLLALFERSFFERNDSFCWVRPDYIVYAVVIPVVFPIINGLICSSFAVYKVFIQAKRGLSNKETTHYDAEFWSKVIGLIVMQVAMGLPWGIEFILIGVSGSSAWNYIFVILLGTQGIDLFLIFLYRRRRLLIESRKWVSREKKWEEKQQATTIEED